jgi:hypothetical protein
MKTSYHLICLRSSNVVGSYDSVEAVLDNMSDAALQHGIAAIEEYGLLMIEGKVQKAVAQDEELAKLIVDHMNSLSH